MDFNARLSKTESQIAHLIAIGKSTKEIADVRCISEITVQTHRANIYRKVGVQKATELCVWWFCRTFNIKIEQIMAFCLLILFCVGECRNFDQDINRSRGARNTRNEASKMQRRIRI